MAGNNHVAKQSADVLVMAEHWPLLEALMGGTTEMRKQGEKFLPKWPAETPGSYGMRLKTATLFPAYARTVSVLTGKPFSKPITVGPDVPQRLTSFIENIDLEGRNLDAFAADIFAASMAYGICGILVDCPPSDGARTAEQEKAAGIRPYFVHVRHDQILGWRTEKHGNRMLLTQLRLMESVEENDGLFSTKSIKQVRVLEPGKWTVYRKGAPPNQDNWVEFEAGTTSIAVIPFVPVYGLRRDYMVGLSPMLELAHLNVEHWQSKSDQQTILHVARVPILFAKNIPDDMALKVGADTFVSASDDNADLKYVEHSGKAIEAGRQDLQDIQERMRLIGAELLISKPGHKTVAQSVSDTEQEVCELQRITQHVEDSLDQALDIMAMFVGEQRGGHVTIYNDFGAMSLAEASANLLLDAQQAGSLSLPTLLNEYKRRSILSADIDVDDEVEAAKKEAAEREPVVVAENIRP